MGRKIKMVIIKILVYVCVYIICSAIFIALFHTDLFSEINVLMYRGILLLLLSGIIAIILMASVVKIYKKLGMDGRDVLLMFCGFCCVNMVFFTLIPVTVERSVSVFMLSYMEESDKEIFSENEIRDAFIALYVDEYGAFQKRFEEQITSGNIVYDSNENGFTITSTGRKMVRLFRIMASLFDTDKRLVYPVSLE